MARIFSTSFNYKNRSYTALVTVASDPESPISVYVPDTSLHSLIPAGKVTLDGAKKVLLNKSSSLDKDLTDSIIVAVKKHEEDTPARSVWN